MPAVVREFIENGTFEGTLEIQRQLIADYREDIHKYAEGVDKHGYLMFSTASRRSWPERTRSSSFQKSKRVLVSKITEGA